MATRARLVLRHTGRILLYILGALLAVGCIPIYIFFSVLQLIGAIVAPKKERHHAREAEYPLFV